MVPFFKINMVLVMVVGADLTNTNKNVKKYRLTSKIYITSEERKAGMGMSPGEVRHHK